MVVDISLIHQTEYCFFRIKNCIDAGREHYIFLGVDGGLWYDKKREITIQASSSSASSSITSISDGKWNKFPSVDIPKYFNKGHIYTYIVEPLIENEECEIQYESTTEKPFRRGSQYVDSDHVHDVMDKLEGNIYKLRAFCFASFQKHQRYLVEIEINNMSGAVISGQCECKAFALGRCSHVSAILLFLEKYCRDKGHSSIASTSKLREWGLGTKDKRS
ncbi:hypothetical protein JTB14_026685 [Gonioctena quinquepunctata]|nr:hypothetical protein JTB14_026685 [Gonioctena quinquepunctata]